MSSAAQRRREALAAVDEAPFSWYHVRAIIVAGVGFFTDAYDIFAVNFANNMIGYVYWPHTGKIPVNADTAIKVATSGGTVLGQLGFGYLADHLGRKKMYGIELMVIIVATLGLSLTAGGRATEIVGVFIFWRVLLGTGIGGDYPLSAIITSEFASVKWRGAMMAAVFANQGWGQLTAALVAFICTVGFKDAIQSGGSKCDHRCQVALDKSWRIIYGFGAIPACAALYFRLTIPETIRYSLDVEGDDTTAAKDAIQYVSGKTGNASLTVDEQAAALAKRQAAPAANTPPKASWADFFQHYSQWKNGKVLLGTAGSWFVLDVAFYGLGLNTSIILSAIGYASPKDKNVYLTLHNQGVGNIILSCAGLIPGYWFSVATIDTVGRKPIQYMGFIMLTIIFCILGFGYHKIGVNGKFALYVFANFFQNFGPNTTTFIVPGEVFPTRYRSTSHGISAASGKCGAIIAQVLIGPLRTRGATKTNASPWLNHVMEIFALFMFVGIFLTYLIPETKRKTLEELSGEDQFYADSIDLNDIEQGKAESSSSHGKDRTIVTTNY